jgi:hypothetical protein
MIDRRASLAAFLPFAAALFLASSPAWSKIDPEDQALIDAANCDEIAREYKNYWAAEQAAERELRGRHTGTAVTNIAGIAAFATLGFGFFTWDDTSDAQEQLTELREIRIAIGQAAVKKSCKL